MNAQISLEMLISMLLSLLIVLFILQSFRSPNALLVKTEQALAAMANAAASRAQAI